MERHFGLPIAFAAAAHAALLFGFSPAPQPVKTDPPVQIVDLIFPPAPEPERKPEPVESQAVERLERPEPIAVRQPEPPSIDVESKFVQPVPPLPPFDLDRKARIAPATLPGAHEIARSVGDIVASGLLDRPPHTRFQARPMYPSEAKKNGQSGEVVVEFIVDEFGAVHEPRVISSSDRVFEDAAVRAVAKWRFEPGRRHNQPVRFRMSVPIVFRLNE